MLWKETELPSKEELCLLELQSEMQIKKNLKTIDRYSPQTVQMRILKARLRPEPGFPECLHVFLLFSGKILTQAALPLGVLWDTKIIFAVGRQ